MTCPTQVSRLVALLTLSFAICSVWSQCFSENDGNTSPGPACIQRFANGSIDFAVDFFKAISTEKTGARDNIFVSPLSVHSALTITYIGTKSNTKTELKRALHLCTCNQKLVIDTYHEYSDDLKHSATTAANYTLRNVDRLYFDERLELRQCVVASLNDEVEKLDFVGSPDPSRLVINQWVENQTNNLITDLLPQGFITSLTRLVVVNAAYFMGYWQTPFQGGATTKQDFHIDQQNTIQVDMMAQTRKSYLTARDQTLRCSAIDLPYSGGNTGMVILLPDQNIRIEDVISGLTRQNLGNLYARMQSTLVNLLLPKFQIRQSMELSTSLKSLGINDLFNSERANLSGFTGSGGLYVTAIRHVTYISVFEAGTEAAAATGVVVGTTSIDIRPVVNFFVDRPFVFFIYEKRFKSVLFIGAIRDPSKNE